MCLRDRLLPRRASAKAWSAARLGQQARPARGERAEYLHGAKPPSRQNHQQRGAEAQAELSCTVDSLLAVPASSALAKRRRGIDGVRERTCGGRLACGGRGSRSSRADRVKANRRLRSCLGGARGLEGLRRGTGDGIRPSMGSPAGLRPKLRRAVASKTRSAVARNGGCEGYAPCQGCPRHAQGCHTWGAGGGDRVSVRE